MYGQKRRLNVYSQLFKTPFAKSILKDVGRTGFGRHEQDINNRRKRLFGKPDKLFLQAESGG